MSDVTRTKLDGVMQAQGRRVGWLAQEVGVHRNTITRWMSGQERMTAQRVSQLAEVLGVLDEDIA